MIKNNHNSITTTHFQYLDLVFEPYYQMAWATFRYIERPCMHTGLLEDVAKAQQIVADKARSDYEQGDDSRLMYQVLSSSMPGVFNVGGDLAYFLKLIRSGDRKALAAYAVSCINILYRSATSYDLPFTTIALVQGETLGGGFEAALSANTLIAEKGSKFGFPETVFGLFPGMGAFSFLARRLSPALAKRIVSSGKVYSAEELYEMGVVDILVPFGKGKEAVYDYIQHQRSRSAGFQGLDRVVGQYNPLTYREMYDAVEVWVDTALKLSDRNQRMMQYLLNAQLKRWESEPVRVDQAVAV
ncbi:MAG: enoyl-CoA hydratase [Gammaproteobacteria bacterium]|nr:enoyl-CoA hydratase [Gammaproteobacteria bacterium]